MNNVKRSQLGFSLVELFCGLFLVSLISAMLIQAYVLNKSKFLAVENTLEQAFDVQRVTDLISDSVKRAGFTPCLNIERLEVIDRRLSPKFITGKAIKIKRDELHVNRMSEHFAELIAVPQRENILITKDGVIQKQNSILIADCEHAEIHQVTQVKKTSRGSLLTLDSPLFFDYFSGTYVGQWIEEYWVIRRTRKGVPALYYKQARSEELSPLVHSLTAKKNGATGNQWVDITLGLDNKKTQELMVGVRS